jgi:hypothetical protein
VKISSSSPRAGQCPWVVVSLTDIRCAERRRQGSARSWSAAMVSDIIRKSPLSSCVRYICTVHSLELHGRDQSVEARDELRSWLLFITGRRHSPHHPESFPFLWPNTSLCMPCVLHCRRKLLSSNDVCSSVGAAEDVVVTCPRLASPLIISGHSPCNKPIVPRR